MWELQVLDADRQATAVVVDYRKLILNQRLYGPDGWRAEFPDTAGSVSELTDGAFVVIAGPAVPCLVDLVERNLETASVSGTCVGGKFAKRTIIPPSGETHHTVSGPAETRLRTYIDAHAGPSADPARQLPGLTLAADEGRGTAGDTSERWSLLADVLQAIGEDAEVGWRIVRDGTDFEWRPIVGRDLTDSVFFDVELDSAAAQRLLDDLRERINVAFVGGPEEGLMREVLEHHVGDEPAGWDRDEAFVDASDAQVSSQLPGRGDEYLAEHGRFRTLEVDVAAHGAFRWDVDWQLGDIVTARSRRWGVTVPLRIVEVEHTISPEGVTQKPTLGKPWPTRPPQIKSAPPTARR